jgi:D-serine deaminase-like pyridoxal phosphate-dependent protein
MNPAYAIDDISTIFSPALIFYKDLIRRNLARSISMAGNPGRLRPHMKTHKTREISRMEVEAGIANHKCATIAEAEILAQSGAGHVLLAYTVVGPNCARMPKLVAKYPSTTFGVVCDHAASARSLSEAMTGANQTIEVFLDVDVGMHRTGVAPGPDAARLYELFSRLPGLRPGGFHVYDGHIHEQDPMARSAAVQQHLGAVLTLRAELEAKGLAVPRLVMGGTPTFPVYACMDFPGLECSPGTCFLHDYNYGARYADLDGFTPAALLLTRVVSRPAKDRVTFDLGYKAVASDPPAGKRLHMLDIPDCEAILQNEEHLVVTTPAAERFNPGDVAFAIPSHVCPTCAMHREAYVVEGGRVIGRWEIAARDRVITV